RELYGTSAYAPKDYQKAIGAKVHSLARRFGIGGASTGRQARRMPEPSPEPEQLSLIHAGPTRRQAGRPR
ncbi:MAG: hypothetical protein ACRDH1_05210, partial [Actinomycetota bacterium]